MHDPLTDGVARSELWTGSYKCWNANREVIEVLRQQSGYYTGGHIDGDAEKAEHELTEKTSH